MVLKKTETPVAQIVSNNSRQVSLIQANRMSQSQTELLVRVQMAMLVKRNWTDVGAQLLVDCENPDFAHKAVYVLPGDPPIRDLSIRFAEHAQRVMTNLSIDTAPENEDERTAYYRTTIVDLESNTPTSETFRVSKVTSKREVSEDEFVIEERKDARGSLYTVEASDQELAARYGAIRSRVKRQLILSLIPADVRVACLDKCLEVTGNAAATDPQAEAKRLTHDYLAIGVEPSEIREYLGKTIQNASAAELVELRGLLTTMREGNSSWAQLLDKKRGAVAAKNVQQAFVAQKQKEKEQAKAAKAGGAKPQGAAGGDAAAPARRGRRTNAQIAADKAAEEAKAKGGTPAPAETTAPPPAPRASRRREEDEEEDDTPESAPASSETSSSNSSTAASA